MKQEEITNNMQKISYQFQEKVFITLIYQEYSMKMPKKSLQEGSALFLPPIDNIQNNFKSEIEKIPKKGTNFIQECLLSSERAMIK
jgi:hypothetical protein